MKVIKYEAAIGSIEALYKKYNKRVTAEGAYLFALRFADVPLDSRLYRQHLGLFKSYESKRLAVRDALTVLSGLGFEIDTVGTEEDVE